MWSVRTLERFRTDMRNVQITFVIDRQVALIIGAAIGVVLIGAIGVSAHVGPEPLLQLAGVHQTQHDNLASGARTELRESPESSHETESPDKPEAAPRAKASATPSTKSHTGSGGGE